MLIGERAQAPAKTARGRYDRVVVHDVALATDAGDRPGRRRARTKRSMNVPLNELAERSTDESGSSATPALPELGPIPQSRSEVVRKWLVRGAVAVVVAVAFGPMVLQASAGVWSGAVALGLAFAPTAIGVYLTFRVLDFPDLTVDASFPAGGAIAAVVITHGWSPVIAVAMALLLGGLLGVLTAVLHITLRINSLLASILTVTAAFTINLRIQGQANVSLLGVDTVFTPVLTPVRDRLESWFGASGVEIHRSVVTALVAAGILAVTVLAIRWLMNTEVGIALRAIGANPQMSKAQGIDTRVYLIAGVALSNALVGVSGAIVAQHQGFADVNSGAGLIIAALAAVIIGEVLFAGRGATVARYLLAVSAGMIVYRIAISLTLATDLDLPLLEPLRLEPSDVRLAAALVVGCLLAVPRLREARRTRRIRGA